jgi:hypothetical protein
VHPARRVLRESHISRDERTTLDLRSHAAPLAVRLLTAPGGQGKTRLAAELCHRRQQAGWVAGFLERPQREADRDRLRDLAGLERPLLLAVDYAETRREEVGALLSELAARPPGGPPARVVLLARAAGDWWRDLLRAERIEVEEALASAEHLPLAPAEPEVAGREEAFWEGRARFAAARGAPAGDARAPDLSAPAFANLLLIHIAALLSLDGPAGRPLGAEELFGQLIGREAARYWRPQAAAARLALADPVLERAVAVATLVGAADQEEAAAALAAIPNLAGDGQRAARHDAADWLHALYPGPDYLNPLEPDLVGEALVARLLLALPDLAGDLLSGAAEGQVARALTVLNRAAPRHPSARAALRRALTEHVARLWPQAVAVAKEGGDPIGLLLGEALSRVQEPGLLRDVLAAMPEQTVALREAAAAATDRLVALLRRALPAEPGGPILPCHAPQQPLQPPGRPRPPRGGPGRDRGGGGGLPRAGRRPPRRLPACLGPLAHDARQPPHRARALRGGTRLRPGRAVI